MDNNYLTVAQLKTFTHGLEDHELIIQISTVIIALIVKHGHEDHEHIIHNSTVIIALNSIYGHEKLNSFIKVKKPQKLSNLLIMPKLKELSRHYMAQKSLQLYKLLTLHKWLTVT